MASKEDPVVLDALALVHIARGDAYGDELVERYGLLTRTITPMVCVVTVGEILRIARRLQPDEPFEATTENDVWNVINQLTVTDITGAVMRAYAKLMAMREDEHDPLRSAFGWVAATAHVHDAVVISHHSDFKKLGSFAKHEVVDRAPFFP